jgi:amidohydrolase
MGDESYLGKIITEHESSWVAWRQDIHAHPELAFQETRTAAMVSRLLKSFGYKVHEGLGKTGVVGTLTVGQGTRMIGLRADMDALPMHEANVFGHRSKILGCMHGCGHDGHTAMLLGAAQALSLTRDFNGTVVVIFQPAEEAAGGGKAMVEDGLFERFPVDAVFGMHNIPGIAKGQFGAMAGPMMASFDAFDITVSGVGGHAAFPHKAVDAIAAASALVSALHGIVSRNLDPFAQAVLSVTEFKAGEGYNVLPPSATLRGTVRCFQPDIQALMIRRMNEICRGINTSWGTTTTLHYDKRYPPTINTTAEAQFARQVIQDTFGDTALLANTPALMAAEDFAFMLQEKPGAYVWIGNGVGSEGGCMVHNPGYDFSDDVLSLGVRYWCALTKAWLQ